MGKQEDTLGTNDKRDLYRGLDDGWTRAIEFALTPVVMGGFGYLIDHWAGTLPAFTIAFVILAVTGTLIKMFYVYDAAMRAHEAKMPWGRSKAGGR